MFVCSLLNLSDEHQLQEHDKAVYGTIGIRAAALLMCLFLEYPVIFHILTAATHPTHKHQSSCHMTGSDSRWVQGTRFSSHMKLSVRMLQIASTINANSLLSGVFSFLFPNP